MANWQYGEIKEFTPEINWAEMGAPGGKEPMLIITMDDNGDCQLYRGKNVDLENIDQDINLSKLTIFPFEIEEIKKLPFGLLIKLKDGRLSFCWHSSDFHCCLMVKPRGST